MRYINDCDNDVDFMSCVGQAWSDSIGVQDKWRTQFRTKWKTQLSICGIFFPDEMRKDRCQ